MSYITSEKKQEIFQEFGGDAKNTGSVEGQIALLTFRINGISAHLKENKKDHSTRLSLLKMVGQRKQLLKYLSNKDIALYRELIAKLGIRK